VAGTGRIAAVRADAGRPCRSRDEAAQLAVTRVAHAYLRIMSDTTVSGLFVDNWASALKDNRLHKIRAKQTVLATGGLRSAARVCQERPSRHHVR